MVIFAWVDFGVPILVIGIMVFLIGTIYVYYYRQDKNYILRELTQSDFKPFGQIQDGEYVVVSGKVLVYDSIRIAPFSERKCVAYHASVKESKQGVDEHWHIVNEVQSTNFFVDTGQGMVLVEVGVNHTSKLDIYFDFVDYASVFGAAKPRYEVYLKEKGRTSKNALGISRSMDFEEGVILPGDDVVVKGIAKWPGSIGTEDQEDELVTQLNLTGTENEKLLVTNRPRAIKRFKNVLGPPSKV